ncbi:hypothetical protein COB55_04455 [Candidatus Wolfebacteria bacterium]|nr:MAG: hypothetical protein COB55_04455 [Candidatus Wolfebacteria bacterium]
MDRIVPGQEFKITINRGNKDHYKSFGYKCKLRDEIHVLSEHLTKGCHTIIKVICDICGNPHMVPNFRYLINIKKHNIFACSLKCSKIKKELTCMTKYGVKHPMLLDETKEKIKEVMLNKFGVPHNWSKIEGEERTCDITMKEMFGVDNVFQNEEIKEKSRQTKIENHDNPSFNNPDKISETKLNKSEEENKIINKKRQETNLERIGVEFPSQNLEIFNKQQKSAFKLKDYTLPSGNIVKVQGFENISLDLLFKQGYKEEDLLIEDIDIEQKIGQIWYIYSDGREHRYIPDIYIISENKLIEVKSTWTFDLHKERNLIKEQHCLDLGFNFEFVVFKNKNGLIVE